ncbi:MAG: hypothetical protein FJ098_02615 [Deltaproteobacteria bacterium]|nr:hypothetical protein [Deltaproteobacteria bacterium]
MVFMVLGVIVLAVVVAWLAQGRVGRGRDPAAPRPEQSAAQAVQPSLDPKGDQLERYPGSPWERRNNLLQEVVVLAEKNAEPYGRALEVRDYLRDIGPALDESCAEILSLLDSGAAEWTAVIAHAGREREALLERWDQALLGWPEVHAITVKGIRAQFTCR